MLTKPSSVCLRVVELMTIFVMNGYTIRPSNNLKHLGVLWNLKNNVLTMDDENITLLFTP